MIRRIFKWSVIGLLILLVAAGLTVYWLAATESGTRWLAARIEPALPAALSIEGVGGTVLRGLELDGLAWRDEAIDATVARIALRAEIMPLLRREVRIVTLDVRQVEVEIRERTAPAGDDRPFAVDLPVTLDIVQASVESLRIRAGDGDFLIDRIDLGARLSGPALEIRRFGLRSELVDVDLQAAATLSDDFPTELSAAWRLKVPNQPTWRGRLAVRGDADGYDLSHDVAAPYEVTTRGSVRFVDGKPEGEFDNTWLRLSVSLDDGRAVVVDDGRLFVSGSIDDFAFDAAALVAVGDIPPLSVTARGRRTMDIVSLESLLVVGDMGRLQTSGSVTIAPALSWALDYSATQLDPSFVDPRLAGLLEAEGTSTGNAGDEALVADLAIERLAGQFNGYPVEGSALLAYRDEQLELRDAAVRVGNNRIDASATFGDGVQADARIALSNLAQLGIDAAGALRGRLSFRSKPDDFKLGGELSGESLAWQSHGVQSLSAMFDLRSAGSGSAEIRFADGNLGTLQIASGNLRVDGGLRSHELRLDLGIEETLGQLHVSGGLLDQAWAGTVRSLRISGEPIGEWDLRGQPSFALSRSAAQLGDTCLVRAAAPGRACLKLDHETSGPLQFAVAVSEYPVAALPFQLPEGASVEGALDVSATGRIIDRNVSADAKLSVSGFRLKTLFEGDEVTVAFDPAEATATITDNHLVADVQLLLAGSEDHLRGQFDVADVFDPRSAIRGHGTLELADLGLLAFFYPDVTKPTGRLSGKVDVAGSLEAPEFIGEIALADGSFGIRRAGITIEGLEVSLRQDRPGLLALVGRARSGDGSLEIRGTTSLSSTAGIRTELGLKGEAFTLVRLPDWYVAASPDITVVIDDRELRVSGELGIPTASINIRTVPETAERASGDVVVHREEAEVATPRRRHFVDIRTVLGDAVSFSGFGLTTRLEGGVRITASNAAPLSGAGRVVLREGRYQAYGQTLGIEQGELVFNGPLDNPALNVRANRKATDGTVAGIHLTGTARQLRSEVYSEPPLSDAEALAYLLTGRPLANADSTEGAMLNQAAFALGLTSAGDIASRLRDELGLETFGIQGGAENRQFVAGRRFGERLFIEYAYGLIDNLGTLLLRYQLSSRLVVESRSGSVRNVDLVYSVRKR